MTAVHLWTYWATLAVTAAAVVVVWRREPLGAALAFGATVLLTISCAARWIDTGHPPIFGAFENTLAAGWSVLVSYLVLRRMAQRESAPELLARLQLLWAPMILGFGLFFNRTGYPLTISERSLWVELHALAAWAAFTVLLAGSTAALAVVAGRAGGAASGGDDEGALAPGEDDGSLAASEEAAAWDRAVFRGAAAGFALLTVMMVLGAWYSYLLFSDWYLWEIAEAFAAAAWLAYGAAIHARLFFGWRDKRLAWCLVIALPLLIGTFWAWSIFAGTYHYFDIPEIRAF